MNRIVEAKQNKIVFMTKCILIILGLLTSVPYVNMVGRDVYKLCCLWSFICIIYLFIKHRENYMKKEYLLFLLFCVSYFLTIVMNFGEHFINEVAILGYTGMLLFGLTYCDKNRDVEEVKKELCTFGWIVVIITCIFSVIGFGMFLFSFSGYFKFCGSTFVYGMRENRLWGLYNPNTGATLNYISIIISILLIKYREDKKKFLVFNIVIQGFCFILAQSRGAWVCVLCYFAIYMLFIRKGKRDYAGVKKWMYKSLLTVCACVVLYVSGDIIKFGLSYVPTGISRILYSNEALAKKHKDLERLDKKNKSLGSVTTGRSDMWKMGIEAYKDAPVFGIGYRSIDDVLHEKMSKSSYLNSQGGGLHNIYVTVLVSCGMVGFLIFAAYLCILLIKITRCFFRSGTPEYVKYILAFIPGWLISELVESRIILGMNFMAIVFWITVGYAAYYAEKGEKNG